MAQENENQQRVQLGSTAKRKPNQSNQRTTKQGPKRIWRIAKRNIYQAISLLDDYTAIIDVRERRSHDSFIYLVTRRNHTCHNYRIDCCVYGIYWIFYRNCGIRCTRETKAGSHIHPAIAWDRNNDLSCTLESTFKLKHSETYGNHELQYPSSFLTLASRIRRQFHLDKSPSVSRMKKWCIGHMDNHRTSPSASVLSNLQRYVREIRQRGILRQARRCTRYPRQTASARKLSKRWNLTLSNNATR